MTHGAGAPPSAHTDVHGTTISLVLCTLVQCTLIWLLGGDFLRTALGAPAFGRSSLEQCTDYRACGMLDLYTAAVYSAKCLLLHNGNNPFDSQAETGA